MTAQSAHRTRQGGKIKAIGVVDDHARLAYCEIHAAETAHNVSVTLRRASVWLGEQGCGPVQAVMSDNAKCSATSQKRRSPARPRLYPRARRPP